MRSRWLAVAAALTSLAGCKPPNLAWQEPKTYLPPAAETLDVAGFGINDTVLVFSPGTPGVTVSHGVTNSGQGAAGAGWVATDSITRWIFQGSPTGGYGWVKGPAATHTAAALAAPGIALAPGASGTLTFSPFAIPSSCGLYGETLRLDTGGAIKETDETDNLDPRAHLFFVPSAQRITITLVTKKDQLFHAEGDVPTHTFNVTTAGPAGVPPGFIYAGFSFSTVEGSRAYTIPAPPLPAQVAPLAIQMHVVTQKHTAASGTIIGKITIISADGCIVRQRSARVFVEHTI